MKTNEGGAAYGAIGKERNKLLAMVAVIALAICLLVSIPTGEANAEPDTSMPEAVNGIITLDNDVQLNASYTVPGYVTEINLNGFTISVSSELESGNVLIVPEGANVSINNGIINGTGNINGILVNGTAVLGNNLDVNGYYALRILGGDVTTNGTDLNAGYVGIYIANADNTNSSDSSTLSMSGGSIKAPADSGYGISGNNLNSAGSEITITGTDIEAAIGIYIPMESEVSISNASITSLVGIEVQMGIVSISGTDFTIKSEYEPEQMPADSGPITTGGAIIIAAQNYGSYETQYVSTPDISVTIGEGNTFDTPGYDVDIFNCKDVPATVQDASVTISSDVGSVRIINDDSGTETTELEVTISDTADVDELLFTGDAEVSVSGTVEKITGAIIGSLTIEGGAYVGLGDGFSTVSGSELINNGSIGVYDADGFKSALVSGGVLEINADIEISDARPFFISTDTIINGNGHSVTSNSSESKSRVFSIMGANADSVIPSNSTVTINDLEVVGPTVVNYTRGITVHDTVNLTLNINGGSVSAGAYAINIGGGNTGLTLNVEDATVSGWCAFQTHSMVTDANFTDCVLIGTNTQVNPVSNGFSTIVINDEAENASEASGDLLFDGCTIVARMTTSATQMAIDLRSMESSTITLRNSEMVLSETTAPMIFMAATNIVTIEGTLDIEGSATIFSENPEDGGVVSGGTINLDEDDVLVLNNGTAYTGQIAGPDGAVMELNNLVAGYGGVTISVGSFIIEGSGTGTITFSDGVEVEGSNDGMNFVFEGNVTFNNFEESENGTLVFIGEGGQTYDNVVDALEAGVEIMLGSNATLLDIPFSTNEMTLEFDYDGTAHSPATGIPFTANEGYTISAVYISGGNCVSGEVPNMTVVAQTNVATYTIQYTLTITDSQGQSTTYTPTIAWSIQPQVVDITHDDITKVYDGDASVDQEFTAEADGLTLGDAYYVNTNAGEGKEVRLPVVIGEESIADNYTFTVNGAVAELMGDAESGYYIELPGSISKKAIDVTVTAPEKEYDGNAYEFTYTVGTGVEGDQLAVIVTTSGADAGTYTGTSDLSFGDPIIMNGDVDVTDNYAVTINDSSALTIDQKDVTVSPAAGAQITKVYNGYSSRVMSADDFQMTDVGDDDVSFTWTNNATYVKYNSPNVDEADTLTVTGLSLTGTDAANYELTSTDVTFVDGENGVTVGITPFVIGFTNGGTISIDKTFDGSVAAPVEDITSYDYTVSASQAGAQPTVTVTTAVYDSADAGTGKTVYVTGIELFNNDHGNFALPETQTSGDISYYFSLSGDGVKIEALEIIGNRISWDISENESGQIVLTLSVSSGKLKPTGFTSSLTASGGTTVTAIDGTNSYVIDAAGSYTAKVTSSDSNWSGIDVEKYIPVEFTYTSYFYTKDTIDGDYILEQTIIGNKQIQTPNATNIPEGYVLCGWALEPNGPMVHGLNVFVNVSAVDTSFYAVYKEDSGSGTTPEQPFVGLMDIVEGAIHYPYDGGFVYTGDFSIVNGNVVVTYDSETGEFLEDLIESGNVPEKVPDELVPMMNDLARFLGALHYSAPSVVESITYDGTFYTWEDHVSNKGNNWYNGNKSLVSVIVADALRSDGAIELILTDGTARYAFTYGVQFEEAPVEPTKELPGIAIDMPVFTESEEGIFQVSFVANDYLNETITVKATFSGTAESVYYWNVNNDDWSAMVAEEGGSYLYGGSGFQLSDATSTFKATISDAGVYTLTVEIIHNDATLASATETFVVVEADVPEYYSVTFDVDGNTSTIKVTAGDYILLSTPSKEGYTFDGWYVQGDDSILYTLYYTPSGDTTLIAKFTEDQTVAEPTYSVAFGTASTLEGLKVGDVVTMPAVTPEENYRLIGWETESGIVLTGQQYYVYAADDANGDKTITLVPVFEKYVFTVTISGGDNGVIGTTEITVNKGETAVITGIEANLGYYVESVTATGGYNVVDFNGSYVIFDVTSDVTVTVTFAADPGAMDITMTAALTEGGVIVTMSSNDGGNLSAGKIEVVYSYTEYDEELGMSIPATGLVEIDYDSVGQTSTSKLVAVTFPATANYAYAQFVVGGEVRAQSAYFAALLES